MTITTTVQLQQDLIEKAVTYSNHGTKRDAIETALREFVATREQKNMSELRGKITFVDNYETDYKDQRASKYSEAL